MIKETLTLENIVKDLNSISYTKRSNVNDWRISKIIPCTLMAVIIGFLLKNVWIGLFIFSYAAYQIYCCLVEYAENKKEEKSLNKAINRDSISISIEELSHITCETNYDPHTVQARITTPTDTTTLYHFVSGASWRDPDAYKHYGWSENYSISPKGLQNVSVAGDKFFYISLQGYYDASYIYPCKFFVLDDDLSTK